MEKCVIKIGCVGVTGICLSTFELCIYAIFFDIKKINQQKKVRHYTDAHKKMHFNFQQTFRVFMPNSSSLTHGETQNKKITFQQKITRQPLVNLIK